MEKYDAFKVFGPLYSTDTIQGSMNAVSINSKYKDECLKFLQLVNTDSKLRDMLAYGVPDKTFKYVGDGVIEKQTDTWPLAAYTQGTFFNMSITEDADPDQWDQVKKQNEEAVSSSCLGFSLDLTNIQNEMSNCLTVWQKYKYDLLTGASDPETAVPAVIQELKAAGFDTVIQEAQKQINRRINQALSASAAAIGANLLIHDVPGNMPLKNDEKLSSLFCKTAEEIFGEGCVRQAPWNCGTSDLGDISCLMPTIHPYSSGAIGTAHGSNYHIVDPVRASVNPAKVLAAMTAKLLYGDASLAHSIIDSYEPVFASKEAYFAAIDAINMNKKTVCYRDDGTVVLDFEN